MQAQTDRQLKLATGEMAKRKMGWGLGRLSLSSILFRPTFSLPHPQLQSLLTGTDTK